jgi:hypothetical protein
MTVHDEQKKSFFVLLLGDGSFCSSFNSMYNPIVRISEMKGNENNEISEKQCQLFFFFLLQKVFLVPFPSDTNDKGSAKLP